MVEPTQKTRSNTLDALECKGCKTMNNRDTDTISRPQWIPVTERMPENNIDVLLTSWSGYSQYVGWLDDFGTWHSGDEEVIKGFEPIAWMPLPDPYQEK